MADGAGDVTAPAVPAGLYTVGSVAPAVASLNGLRAESLAQYLHDGFLSVSRGLSPAETQEAISGLTALILREDSSGYQLQFEGGREAGSQLSGEARVDAVRKLMMFIDHESRLRAIAEHPGILAVVERLLGAPPVLIRDWQLCDGDVMGLSCTAIPLPPGGILFFDGLLHHGTPPNLSGARRRALQFHYVSAQATKITAEEHLKHFGSEGKNATC